jgi:hypothetical protein
MSEASRRLGISDSSLFNWVRLERAGKLGSSAGVSATPRSAKELEAEVDRLRRELASAKVDNEILKNGLRGSPRPNGWKQSALHCRGDRIVAVGFLEAKTPSKNLVREIVQTRLWRRIERPRLGK